MTFTPEIILATRQHLAGISQACIEAAQSGKVLVNNLDSYIAYCKEQIECAMAGKYDHTFTFQQHARYLATGECIALLPSNHKGNTP